MDEVDRFAWFGGSAHPFDLVWESLGQIARRLAGESYIDILESGGGILSTVRQLGSLPGSVAAGRARNSRFALPWGHDG